MTSLRLFVAIPLEEEVRTALHAAAAPLRDAAPGLRWTPAGRLHLTVKFLGDTPQDRVGPLEGALRDVARAHAAVPLVIRGAGAFPTLRRPRVVWAGVDPAPRLELLQHDVESAFAALGIPVEGRAFRPHVTLARAGAPIALETARALARAVRRFDFGFEGDASSLDLMQSSLTTGGARYVRIATATLRAG